MWKAQLLRYRKTLEMVKMIPHAIPYQGSKRRLASNICAYFPSGITTLYEPFAGSAAISIYAAAHSVAKQFVIGDISQPQAHLLKMMIDSPEQIIGRYRDHWLKGCSEGKDYFYIVRESFNLRQEPSDLLYLICRSVKNSIRYGKDGRFTQSVDKRRLGMHPDSMRRNVLGISGLLRGRSVVISGDWRETISSAGPNDFVYLDPPYEGVSTGADRRYVAQLSRSSLIKGIDELNDRRVGFALSYDGMTGEKQYGEPLPTRLGMRRVLLDAGISTQSVLNGSRDSTVESLYLSRFNKRRMADLMNVDTDTPLSNDLVTISS